MSPKTCLLSLLALSLAFAPSPAAAQSIGTFRWQLAPYCNVVTAVVTQMGAVYRLDGSDNQCDVGMAWLVIQLVVMVAVRYRRPPSGS